MFLTWKGSATPRTNANVESIIISYWTICNESWMITQVYHNSFSTTILKDTKIKSVEIIRKWNKGAEKWSLWPVVCTHMVVQTSLLNCSRDTYGWSQKPVYLQLSVDKLYMDGQLRLQLCWNLSDIISQWAQWYVHVFISSEKRRLGLGSVSSLSCTGVTSAGWAAAKNNNSNETQRFSWRIALN